MSEFRMPSLGADMEAGTLVAWRKKPGETLRRGDVIGEVETDKGVIEVEVYEPGVLERYLIEPGTKVPVGTPLAVLRPLNDDRSAAGRANEVAYAPSAVPTPPTAQAEPAAEQPTRTDVARDVEAAVAAATHIVAPPSVRRRARELGVDLQTLHERPHVPTRLEVEQHAESSPRMAQQASPPSARVRSSPAARKRASALGIDLSLLPKREPDSVISLRDVERAQQDRAAAAVHGPVAASPTSRSERQAAMRRAVGTAMARAKREVPHYYLGTTIDLGTALDWLSVRNAAHGVQERLLPAALLLKAVALATRRMPEFNTRYERDRPSTSARVHLGVAIALQGGGLVAPALHDADQASLQELMTRLQDLVVRARAGTLRSSELSDGTITVTNLGERGVESVFPIVYAPQTAIVGFGRIAQRPWVVDGALAVRPLVQASLAADHRVTDGHLGARFLDLIDRLLQEPKQL